METDTSIEYFGDRYRHLVCVPYTVENLHKMAAALNIKRCWYHSGSHPHYAIPKSRIREILAKVTVVSSEQIVAICLGNAP